MAIVLGFGMAYAEDMIPGNKDTGEKMIRNEDLEKYNQDQSKSTVNQMPSRPGAEGSAAGGSGESDSTLKDDTSDKPAPLDRLEKNFPEPYDRGRGGKEDPYKDIEKHDGDTYRY